MNRAERAIAFVERYCRVPDGKFVGEPLVFADFQKELFHGIFGRRKIRRAIWSMAKKNAKTATIACLVLVFLVGTEAKLNTQIVSGAMSRDQAALVFDMCCKIIRQSSELSAIIKIKESTKTLVGVPMNVTYKALSAEGKTAHGLSPLVVIMDELGQVVGARSEFYEALNTAQGAHDDPLQIIISTQAASDSDLLSILIDDAETDDTTYCKVYEAPEGCSVLDEDAWHAANPALGLFRSLTDVKDQAEAASRMPSSESSFRNLILNQRVSVNSPFVSRGAWQLCDAPPLPIEDWEEIYAGLDLSGKTDLTALVLYGRTGDEWSVIPYFWTPEIGLLERAKKDRAPYDVWVDQGFIETTPGATVDYEFVAAKMGNIFSEIDLEALAFDRWRMEILRKELMRIDLELPLEDWGQGFKDMSPSLEALEGKILNKTLRHGGNPVLNMCAANAMVTADPSGNRKLDKMKTSGRIDGMQALAMAAGIAERQSEERPQDISEFLTNPIVIS